MSCLACAAVTFWALGTMIRAAIGWCGAASRCSIRCQVVACTPPGSSTSGSVLALLHDGTSGPLSLDDFCQLVREQWAQLGMARRPLTERELAELARRAGFGDGLQPHQQPLPPGSREAFQAWFDGHLDVIRAVGPAIYGCAGSQLVAGFDVGRAEAVECLRLYGLGAFCLRLSSLPGHLVLSLVEGSQSGTGRIRHYLFPAARLRRSGLPRMLGAVPGGMRLVDVSTGKVYRRSVVRKAAAWGA